MLFLAMAIGPVRRNIDAFDLWFHELVYPIKWGPITVLSYIMAFLGGVYFVWPLRAVVTVFLALRRRWVGLGAWLLGIGLSEPLIGLSKALYDRPRPPDHLVTEVTGAFPSGHAIVGSVVALSLVIVLVPRGAARRNLEMAAAAFAFVMAGSRVYLGAHWLTDVFAGLALGAACAVGGAAIAQRWFRARWGVQPYS
jgi:undecaprenyl-diphosphatase